MLEITVLLSFCDCDLFFCVVFAVLFPPSESLMWGWIGGFVGDDLFCFNESEHTRLNGREGEGERDWG